MGSLEYQTNSFPDKALLDYLLANEDLRASLNKLTEAFAKVSLSSSFDYKLLQKLFEHMQSWTSSHEIVSFIPFLANLYDNLLHRDIGQTDVSDSICELLYLVEDMVDQQDCKVVAGEHFLGRLVALTEFQFTEEVKLKRAAVETLSSLILMCPSNQRVLSENMSSEWQKIIKRVLPKCGDFFVQASIVEIFYRLSKRSVQLLDLLEDAKLRDRMLSLHQSKKPDLHGETRAFLDYLNKSLGHSRSVCSFLAEDIIINGQTALVMNERWVHFCMNHITFFSAKSSNSASMDPSLVDVFYRKLLDVDVCSNNSIEISTQDMLHPTMDGQKSDIMKVSIYLKPEDLALVKDFVLQRINCLKKHKGVYQDDEKNSEKMSSTPSISTPTERRARKASIGFTIPLPRKFKLPECRNKGKPNLSEPNVTLEDKIVNCEINDQLLTRLSERCASDGNAVVVADQNQPSSNLVGHLNKHQRRLSVLNNSSTPASDRSHHMEKKPPQKFSSDCQEDRKLESPDNSRMRNITNFNQNVKPIKQKASGQGVLNTPSVSHKNNETLIENIKNPIEAKENAPLQGLAAMNSAYHRKRDVSFQDEKTSTHMNESNQLREKILNIFKNTDVVKSEITVKKQKMSTSDPIETDSDHVQSIEGKPQHKQQRKQELGPNVRTPRSIKNRKNNLQFTDRVKVNTKESGTQKTVFDFDSDDPCSTPRANSNNNYKSNSPFPQVVITPGQNAPGVDSGNSPTDVEKTPAEIAVDGNVTMPNTIAYGDNPTISKQNLDIESAMLNAKQAEGKEDHTATNELHESESLPYKTEPRTRQRKRNELQELDNCLLYAMEPQTIQRTRNQLQVSDSLVYRMEPQRRQKKRKLSIDSFPAEKFITSTMLETVLHKSPTPSKEAEATVIGHKLSCKHQTEKEIQEFSTLLYTREPQTRQRKRNQSIEIFSTEKLIKSPKPKTVLHKSLNVASGSPLLLCGITSSPTSCETHTHVESMFQEHRHRNSKGVGISGIMFGKAYESPDHTKFSPRQGTKDGDGRLQRKSQRNHGFNFSAFGEENVQVIETDECDANNREMELLAVLLDKILKKIKARTEKKCTEILSTVKVNIENRCQEAHEHIQSDIDAYTKLSTEKLDQLQMQVQEERENFECIQKKWKDELSNHLQRFQDILSKFEAEHNYLKSIPDKQKVAHRKLLVNVTDFAQQHLVETKRRLLTVHQAAKALKKELKEALMGIL